MSKHRGIALLALFFALAPAGAEELSVSIAQPPAGEPIFGEVAFAVDPYPPDEVERVDFYLDGELLEQVDSPPYEVTIDVGEENREHRFAVKAIGRSGDVAEALLVSPAIRVDLVVDAQLQQLYVTVTRGGERQLGLEQDDFAIFDDRNREQMVTFARGDVRLTAAILVDSSASMVGARLRYALGGAAAFVEALKPIDDASIMLFSDRLLHSTPFSNDLALLSSGLTNVEAAGGTALNDHLYLALKRLEQEQGRRVVILLSDGIDSHSALRMTEVTWLARRSRALLYWIRTDPRQDDRKSRFSAWKDADDYRAELQLLGETVRESGGRIVALERLEDADEAFRDILSELREQYVLGYYPTDPRNDGSWRSVTVRVRDSALDVRTRDGYIDY